MSDAVKEKIRNAHLQRGVGISATKRCPTCGEVKDRSEFGIRKNGYSRAQCRLCENAGCRDWQARNPERVKENNRRTTLKRWFGITVQQYDELSIAQNGVCAICGSAEGARNRLLHVDHCHATGRIRGLLCGSCNTAIGMLKDDAALMAKAIAYVTAPVPDNALYARPEIPSGRGRG